MGMTCASTMLMNGQLRGGEQAATQRAYELPYHASWSMRSICGCEVQQDKPLPFLPPSAVSKVVREMVFMQAPVFRELYSEKKVVAEERRSRIDNSPMGRFQETFLSSAISNNYRRPIIGYEQDVAALGRREIEAFFRERYGPQNLVITIVGDTKPEKVLAALSRASSV